MKLSGPRFTPQLSKDDTDRALRYHIIAVHSGGLSAYNKWLYTDANNKPIRYPTQSDHVWLLHHPLGGISLSLTKCNGNPRP